MDGKCAAKREYAMAINSACCPRCETTAKLRPRDFSDQATASLVSHGDLDRKAVGKPICDECYDELRDVLIDYQRHEIAPVEAPAKPKKTGKKAG